MTDFPILGVIGGSGLYTMEGLTEIREHDITTPFGKPSTPIISGILDGKSVAFLARHGKGHFISPSEINFRANIYAFKSLGVNRIISISACGSLREDFQPGHIVIPDQIFDFTKNRKRTFFEDGLVAHVSVADPFCPDLSSKLYSAIKSTGIPVHEGGTYITVEGPRFSTRSESHTYRAWGMSIIGMTTSPEAFLAREAEICYSVMAHVTDYDVWHISEEPVSVEMVIERLSQNTTLAQTVVKKLVSSLEKSRSCECEQALEKALITAPEKIPLETKNKLELLINKYLK